MWNIRNDYRKHVLARTEVSRVGSSDSKRKATVIGRRYSLNCMETYSWVRPAHRSSALCGTYLETLHGLFAGQLYKQYVYEMKEHLSVEDFDAWYNNLLNYEEVVREEIINHEDAVIDYVFTNVDSINDITAEQMKAFIRSRSNEVTSNLSPELVTFTIDSNPIADWFYRGANSIKMHDFFVAGTNQYRRNWKTENLSLKPFLKELEHE